MTPARISWMLPPDAPSASLAVDFSLARGPMHRRLREATGALHRRIEAELDVLAPDLTIERYRRILETFHGYYEPLERRIADAIAATAEPPSFAVLSRGALLRRDLAALGVPPSALAELPRCAELPTLRQTADLAGCLYVVEGAALGGRLISAELGPRLGISAGRGASFFVGEGPRTGARWKAVLAWIECVAVGASPGDAIVDAAAETFRTLERWCSEQSGA